MSKTWPVTSKVLQESASVKRPLPSNIHLLSAYWLDVFKEICKQNQTKVRLLEGRFIGVDTNAVLWESSIKCCLSHHEFSEIRMLNSGVMRCPKISEFLSHPRSQLNKLIKHIIFRFQTKTLNLLPTDRPLLIFWDNRCTANVYHWFVDALVRLNLYVKNGVFEKPYLVIPEDALNRAYVLPTLKALGFSLDDILLLKSNKRYLADRIQVITPTIFSTGACSSLAVQYMREKLILASENPTEFVYLARKIDFGRRIVNGDEFEDLITKCGFRKIYTEDYSYEDLRVLLGKTKVVIAVFGAALAYMTLMPSKSSVIEIANHDVFTKTPLYWEGNYHAKYSGDYYYSLAVACGLNYHLIPCKKTDASQDTMVADILVDLELTKKTLSLVCFN
jgi:hypothetical protein